MEKIKREWIDLLFVRLSQIFRESYLAWNPTKEREELNKSVWACGLIGLSAEEIRYALSLCAGLHEIPTVIEFYHYAKGIRMPVIRELSPLDRGDQKLAKAYLDEIKKKVQGKLKHGKTY